MGPQIEMRGPGAHLGGGLKRFDPNILLGDMLGFTLYGMLAEGLLKGNSSREERLYTKFVSHCPGEAKIHTPESVRRLIDIIRSEGIDIRKPKQIRCNPAEHTMINGAHRCAIAIQLGITDVPYSLSFQDGRMDEERFRRIFSPGEFELLEAKRAEYIARSDPSTQLKCNLRLHMWRNLDSFQAPFSSKTRTPAVRLYQGLETLGIAGKRPTLRRLNTYGLSAHLDRSMDVLEVGCNVGFISLSIAGQVGHIDAVERDPNYITVAEMVKSALGVHNCQFHTSSFQDFRATRQYDLVVSTAFHGWTKMPFETYLARVLELVKPGGLVLFESHELSVELDWPLKRRLLAGGLDVIDSGIIDDVDTSMYESEIREFLILRKRAEGPGGGVALPSLDDVAAQNGLQDGPQTWDLWDLPEPSRASASRARFAPRRLVKRVARRALGAAARIVEKI